MARFNADTNVTRASPIADQALRSNTGVILCDHSWPLKSILLAFYVLGITIVPVADLASSVTEKALRVHGPARTPSRDRPTHRLLGEVCGQLLMDRYTARELVFNDTNLSRGVRMLYLTLDEYQRSGSQCFPRQRTLRTKLCCSQATLKRWLSKLIEAGLCTVQREYPGGPNIYRLYHSSLVSPVAHR